MIGAETLRNVQDQTMKTTGEVLGFGRKFWLAGLGTVATVEQEVRDVFGNLVEKGKSYDQTREHKVGQAVDGAKESVNDVTDRVENAVQGAVAGTLHRFGVPTREEVHALIDRVEALTEKVEKLSNKK